MAKYNHERLFTALREINAQIAKGETDPLALNVYARPDMEHVSRIDRAWTIIEQSGDVAVVRDAKTGKCFIAKEIWFGTELESIYQDQRQ